MRGAGHAPALSAAQVGEPIEKSRRRLAASRRNPPARSGEVQIPEDCPGESGIFRAPAVGGAQRLELRRGERIENIGRRGLVDERSLVAVGTNHQRHVRESSRRDLRYRAILQETPVHDGTVALDRRFHEIRRGDGPELLARSAGVDAERRGDGGPCSQTMTGAESTCDGAQTFNVRQSSPSLALPPSTRSTAGFCGQAVLNDEAWRESVQ